MKYSSIKNIKNHKVIGKYKTYAEGALKTQKKEKIGTFVV